MSESDEDHSAKAGLNPEMIANLDNILHYKAALTATSSRHRYWSSGSAGYRIP